ncbi:hypothetical protein CWI58_11695 [Neisseria meningitidis]|nr:hypothetical protein CWI58_11695 [Neisseria meningitidis]
MTGFEIAAFIGSNRNRSAVIPTNLHPVIPTKTETSNPVIPAQAGIQTCRCGRLSDKTVS